MHISTKLLAKSLLMAGSNKKVNGLVWLELYFFLSVRPCDPRRSLDCRVFSQHKNVCQVYPLLNEATIMVHTLAMHTKSVYVKPVLTLVGHGMTPCLAHVLCM